MCVGTCAMAPTKVKGQLCGVGSIYPNVVSKDQTLVTRPVWQVLASACTYCAILPQIKHLSCKICIHFKLYICNMRLLVVDAELETSI